MRDVCSFPIDRPGAAVVTLVNDSILPCIKLFVKWYMKCFIYWTADLKSSKPWSSLRWSWLTWKRSFSHLFLNDSQEPVRIWLNGKWMQIYIPTLWKGNRWKFSKCRLENISVYFKCFTCASSSHEILWKEGVYYAYTPHVSLVLNEVVQFEKIRHWFCII